jgi:hypothetical protein
MTERLDILVRQELSQFVTAFHWEYGSDGIEFFHTSRNHIVGRFGC